MKQTAGPWVLTDDEWAVLRPILPRQTGAGRPRVADDRALAQAMIFRHFAALSGRYRAFDWNDLPADLGVSPKTANRRYKQWTTQDGGRVWAAFWTKLQEIRRVAVDEDARPPVEPSRFPAADLAGELARAYDFFNERFFGGSLAPSLALTVEHHMPWNARGYFCAGGWRHEKQGRRVGLIAINVHLLQRGVAVVLETLLHEMVHLRNDQNISFDEKFGAIDVHPKTQYHNRFFRDLAVRSGLSCCPRHPRYGYAKTSLDADGRKAVADLKPNEALFNWTAAPGDASAV
ncbi:MAG: transposase [Planctomycetia bacterium]